jgi:hypothetical protein
MLLGRGSFLTSGAYRITPQQEYIEEFKVGKSVK